MSIDRRQMLACGLAAAGIAPVFGQVSPADRLTLWDNRTGPHLRGAVLVQRRVYPQIDGPEFLGPGPVGSPVSDQALAGLAASGANLVVLSHPGIVSETPPYRVDRVILEHLQDMVARCARPGSVCCHRLSDRTGAQRVHVSPRQRRILVSAIHDQ